MKTFQVFRFKNGEKKIAGTVMANSENEAITKITTTLDAICVIFAKKTGLEKFLENRKDLSEYFAEEIKGVEEYLQ